MKKIVLDNASGEWNSKIAEFFKSIGFEYEFVNVKDGADLIIDFPSEREISTQDILHSGGKIACADAFIVSSKLKISRTDFGKFANLLDIKIFNCQLGCFK